MTAPFQLFVSSVWLMMVIILMPAAFAQLYAGSTCLLPDKTYGVCKALRLCKWFINGLEKGTFGYDQRKRCSFEGENEIICCADERPSVNPTRPSHSVTTDSDGDIIFRNNLISGESSDEERPWDAPSKLPTSRPTTVITTSSRPTFVTKSTLFISTHRSNHRKTTPATTLRPNAAFHVLDPSGGDDNGSSGSGIGNDQYLDLMQYKQLQAILNNQSLFSSPIIQNYSPGFITSTPRTGRGFITPTSQRTTPSTVTSEESNFRTSVNKIDEACSNYTKLSSPFLQQNILNGIPTELGEFPHMVAIGTPSQIVGTSGYTFDCGGTLISEFFVLTAAHCTRIEPSIARLGKISLNTNADGAKAQDIDIAEIITHPRYRSPQQYNDIALLRLRRAVVFDDNVRPACINTKLEDLEPTVELIVTGWGRVSSGGPTSSVLLKAEVSTVPLVQCNTSLLSYDANNRRLPNGLVGTQYCAANAKKNDACQGDSGGPLQIYHNNGMSTVVGIISFGVLCGTDIPSVYTRVAEYIDWIEGVVWPTTI